MLEIFDTDTECFIVLELLSGGSLLDLLQKRGRLPESECRTTVRQIASGLKAVHDLGIVHRDLKPENILFDADGVAKLVDFGFAKAFNTGPDSPPTGGGGSMDGLWTHRFASSPCGTPGFVAPEVQSLMTSLMTTLTAAALVLSAQSIVTATAALTTAPSRHVAAWPSSYEG